MKKSIKTSFTRSIISTLLCIALLSTAFAFSTITVNAADPIESGRWYNIYNFYSGKYLDLQNGSYAVGTHAVQYPSTLPSRPTQSWQIQKQSNGYYRIRCMATEDYNRQLDANGSTAGTQVVLKSYAAGAYLTQEWSIRPLPGGGYEISPRNNANMALALATKSTANNVKVQLKAGNIAMDPTQRWSFIRVY